MHPTRDASSKAVRIQIVGLPDERRTAVMNPRGRPWLAESNVAPK
jgi:hypothetical protein